MPAGVTVIVVSTDGGEIVSVYACIAEPPTVSAALIVKLEVPAVVGVPVNAPAELKVNPAGSVPELTDQVNDGVPPEAAKLCEYALPTLPFGNGDAVVIDGAGLMMIDRAFVAVPLALSATLAVKLNVPAALGVPVKAPVDVFRLTPAGSDPTLIDHV
jgi:hypothetical protein